ncbi:ubiquitin-conjugating enzyme E2 Z isoform X2 [Oncorhynchus masou masou]|uniref:ubiquitin-conjugating enzyme E2 Z isoform X2 n=1 Tax=Oncorhynchus masou masou TaxID=90313 RepID=UPI003182C5F8
MADSVGEVANGEIGLGVGSQGNGAPLLQSLGNSLPGHSSSGGNPVSPSPTAAAETGLAVMAPGAATTSTMGTGSGFAGALSAVVGSAIPIPTYSATNALPGGIGLGVAGAGLLSQIHATSWDPTLSTDWDNEKTSQQCILRIKRDIMSIYKEPPPGMFVVPDPHDMTKIHALITGPFDTPYEGGFFLFLFRCPPDYPIHPPRVKLITTGQNTVRFNPNFYRNGKVCLSILGTWTGPAWSPAQSISSVLISIQSLMTENPYHNEPGFEQLQTDHTSVECVTFCVLRIVPFTPAPSDTPLVRRGTRGTARTTMSASAMRPCAWLYVTCWMGRCPVQKPCGV